MRISRADNVNVVHWPRRVNWCSTNLSPAGAITAQWRYLRQIIRGHMRDVFCANAIIIMLSPGFIQSNRVPWRRRLIRTWRCAIILPFYFRPRCVGAGRGDGHQIPSSRTVGRRSVGPINTVSLPMFPRPAIRRCDAGTSYGPGQSRFVRCVRTKTKTTAVPHFETFRPG